MSLMGVTDHMVCFALYSATRAVTRAYRSLLEPWGLTYPQYLVLAILWNHGDQPVHALGDSMQLDSGTLSPLLRRLEKSGYVTRDRSGRDSRVVTVALTAKGVALREELADVPAKIAETMGVADGADAADLIHSLTRLCDSVRAAPTAHTAQATPSHERN